jgi:arylsulfatase A-like enzyme
MNVIWIVADTFRSDAIGVYGNEKIHTPSIDALAEKSVRFDNHYAASFPTMPARADFLTGRWSAAFMKWAPLPENEVTVGELLQEKDINTAAIVDTPFYFRDGMNYDRGFTTCEEIKGQYYMAKGSDPRFRGRSVRETNVRVEADCFARQTFTKAMQWLELNYKEDFFLYIDTWDPHEPWNAPDYYTQQYWPEYNGERVESGMGYISDSPGVTPEAVEKSKAAYWGEVTMVDTWLGHFLDQVENMGLMQNTAIVFTTDHGTYFNEHGGIFGKIVYLGEPTRDMKNMPKLGRSPLYREVVNIPLLIYMPEVDPGTYNKLTSAVDLMPTVLDIMGINPPDNLDGKTLLPAVRDTGLSGHEYVFSCFPFLNKGDKKVQADMPQRDVEHDSLITITSDEWSLIYDSSPGLSELYNLKNDPHQTNDVISIFPDVANELHQALLEKMKTCKVDQRFITPRLELLIR